MWALHEESSPDALTMQMAGWWQPLFSLLSGCCTNTVYLGMDRGLASQKKDNQAAFNSFREKKNQRPISQLLRSSARKPGSSPSMSLACRCVHAALGDKQCSGMEKPCKAHSSLTSWSRKRKNIEQGRQRQFGNCLGKDSRPSWSQLEKVFQVCFLKILSNTFFSKLTVIQALRAVEHGPVTAKKLLWSCSNSLLSCSSAWELIQPDPVATVVDSESVLSYAESGSVFSLDHTELFPWVCPSLFPDGFSREVGCFGPCGPHLMEEASPAHDYKRQT